MTNKTADCLPDDTLSFLEFSSISEDNLGDEFKKLLIAQEDEEKKRSEKAQPLPTPMDLFSMKSINLTLSSGSEKTESISQIVPSQEVLAIISEKIGFLSQTLHESGVMETSLMITSPDSLLDQVEITLKNSDTAITCYNIEIKSCDKLCALLQSQTEALLTALAGMAHPMSVNCLALNGRLQKIPDSKLDKEQFKKVREVKKGT